MKWLITGGCGFIGSNLAEQVVAHGDKVVLLDNVSRPGAQVNLAQLAELGDCVLFAYGDIRNARDVDSVFERHADVDVVTHLAAQVAVTTSVIEPRADFEANAIGTFNVLEAARRYSPDASLLYASTNKVYGSLENEPVVLEDDHYRFANLPNGVAEDVPLDFHSPYGCSKGAADQYVRDYHRIFGLKTVTFRQSCIYGDRQFGVEDQGWVAWMTICAALKRPITIFGDGMQVRDVLFIDDLVRCYRAAVDSIDLAAGNVYNVGGGMGNTISLLDLIAILESKMGRTIDLCFDEWRPGDQRVFVCDVGKIRAELGWKPETIVEDGVDRLLGWVNRHMDSIMAHIG